MQQHYFGISTSLDVINCDLYSISNAEIIKSYIDNLVGLLDMKKYGESNIVYFGNEKVEGYSFTQLIETSLISGHFCNSTRKAYVDIFSCKEYKAELAAEFTRGHFRGTEVIVNTFIRR